MILSAGASVLARSVANTMLAGSAVSCLSMLRKQLSSVAACSARAAGVQQRACSPVQQQPRLYAQVAYAEKHEDSPVAIPEVHGRIHSTESFSAVDGPGVRFLVFTQGCAMRCLFCSNPDTWCASGGEQVSSKDIATQVKSVAPYLRPGGGGVTCSGGEAMLQPEFTAAIFQEAHALGLTTCLDTTGQGTKHRHWDKVLPYTDMVLFCIKHLDAKKYEGLTAMKQIGALKFAQELKSHDIPFWLRYVLIPGHTDDAVGISKLIDFCHDQPSLQGVELLPYHLLGKNKWDEMGLKYPLEGVQTPPIADTLKVVDQLEDAGINVICDAKRYREHASAAH